MEGIGERLILLITLVALAFVAYQGVRRWQVQRVAAFAPRDPLLNGLRPGVPAILYFTTPICAPCKTQQRPALQRLVQELGEQVQIIEVNALEQPDAADRWGVLSVPTTFILDRQGRPRQINHGVAGAEKLKQQLTRLEI
jgi:thiol-disulfide isomerase/thioredoxin